MYYVYLVPILASYSIPIKRQHRENVTDGLCSSILGARVYLYLLFISSFLLYIFYIVRASPTPTQAFCYVTKVSVVLPTLLDQQTVVSKPRIVS